MNYELMKESNREGIRDHVSQFKLLLSLEKKGHPPARCNPTIIYSNLSKLLLIPILVLLRMVGAAHVGTALHMLEPHGERLLPVEVEPFRPDERLHRVVALARRQVLSHGEIGAPRPPQVGEDLQHLRFRLAEADHDPRLGLEPRIKLPDGFENGQGTLVVGAAADLIEAGDGLHVVADDVRPCIDNGGDAFPIALEVGDEEFDPRRWGVLPIAATVAA